MQKTLSFWSSGDFRNSHAAGACEFSEGPILTWLPGPRTSALSVRSGRSKSAATVQPTNSQLRDFCSGAYGGVLIWPQGETVHDPGQSGGPTPEIGAAQANLGEGDLLLWHLEPACRAARADDDGGGANLFLVFDLRAAASLGELP
jgi:hypothetical protein